MSTVATPPFGLYQCTDVASAIQLKSRNGSSRPQLKKYVKANNTLGTTSDTMFDSLFNKALKTGVAKGVFEQPKGPSGGTKLAKKTPAAAAAKKEAAPKKAAAEPKEKKEVKEKKAPAPKKAAAPKKEAKEPKEKKAAAPKKEKKPAAKKEKVSHGAYPRVVRSLADIS